MIKKVTITVEQEALSNPFNPRRAVLGIEANSENDVQIVYVVSYGDKVWTETEPCSYDGAQAVWDAMLAKACKIAVEETNGTRD